MSTEHQRITRLAPLHEVHACIDAIAKPLAPRKELVWQAVGHVLARDVKVGAPVPARAVALREGWAVASDQITDAGPYSPMPMELAPVWVERGDPMPVGADAVLAPDAVTLSNGLAEAVAAAVPGENVLAAGMDAEAETPLRKAGERLRRTDAAALQLAGIDRVWIRTPRIGVVACHPKPAGSKDFVGNLIFDTVQSESCRISEHQASGGFDLGHLLTHGACDAIIGIGGTGMGKADASVTALARLGRVHIHGMGISPGETAALGTIESYPVLLLPGRLDDALAAWLLVGRRLYARLTGLKPAETTAKATLVRKIISTIGVAEMIPVGYCQGGVEPLASGYLSLQSLTRAAGWIFAPPESEGFAEGTSVALQPLP